MLNTVKTFKNAPNDMLFEGEVSELELIRRPQDH